MDVTLKGRRNVNARNMTTLMAILFLLTMLGIAAHGAAPVARAQDPGGQEPWLTDPIEICQVQPELPDCVPQADETLIGTMGPAIETFAVTDDPVELAEVFGDATPLPSEALGTWDAWSGPVGPDGGWRRRQLGVTAYSQRDGRWSNDVMRTCNRTIGAAGCTVSSVAMAINYLGAGRSPGTLNSCMGNRACPLEWGKVAPQCGLGKIDGHYVYGFSYENLRTMINGKRPPVHAVRSGGHWVVVTGYYYEEGRNPPADPYYYLTIDPYDGQAKRLSAYAGTYGSIHMFTPRGTES